MSSALVLYVLKAAVRDRLVAALFLAMLVAVSLSLFMGSAAVSEKGNFAIVFAGAGLRLAGIFGLVLFAVFFIRRAVTAQVLIEAKILEVALSDEHSTGIDWRAMSLGDLTLNYLSDGFGVLGTQGPGSAPIPDQIVDPTQGTFVLGAGGNDFQALIKAISGFGNVRALASPRLTVLNNQSAVLNVAENRVYFELDIDVSEGNQNTPPRTTIDSNIRNVPEGVLINVQPSIDLENEVVSMAVRPTVTRITSFVNDPAVSFVAAANNVDVSSPIPVVNVQEFDSVIQMNNGQAIVMGGLIQDRTDSQQNAVPVLGEMPLVGGLFRNQRDAVNKTELVVFLKATIVEGGNTIHNTDKDLYRAFSQDRRPFDM